MTQDVLPILDGRTDPPPEARTLRAGPLSVVFESGDLRYLRLGDREVIRRIYVAVRDRNWGTVPARLADVTIDEQPDRFLIRYVAEHAEGPVDFVWRATIEGRPDGSLRFAMDGEARSTFLRNRIGFCVLHPIRECAGARCRLTHADGTTREAEFPRFVAPQNPFLELIGLSHEVTPERMGGPPVRGRRVRDRGPAQLDRRLVQDLLHAPAVAIPRRDPGRHQGPPGGHADDRRARRLEPPDPNARSRSSSWPTWRCRSPRSVSACPLTAHRRARRSSICSGV